MPSPEYTWDRRLARYRGAGGRLVGRAEVMRALDHALAGTGERARALGQRLRSGQVGLPEWQQGMLAAIKDAHLYSAALARGGWAQMSSEDWGYVGPRVRFHYGKLQQWAEQLEAGTAPLDGRFTARSEMYFLSARGSWDDQDMRQQQAIGMTEEANVPHGENCPDCQEQTAMGWVPIGTLARPGQRACLSRCRCTVRYR